MRSLFGYLAENKGEWDWIDVSLRSTDGWLEQEFFRCGDGRAGAILARGARACVLVDLPDTWEAFLSSLRRNVRESIRRTTNRLNNSGKSWSVHCVTCPSEVEEATETVIQLHRERAGINSRSKHSDYFADPNDRAFALTATKRLAEYGLLEVRHLLIDGQAVAGAVTLRGTAGVFASFSGATPAAWDYGPTTALLINVFQSSIAEGSRWVNLSSGPSVAKLRWSETLETYVDFSVVGPYRRSKVAFAMYWPLRSVAAFRRECGHADG